MQIFQHHPRYTDLETLGWGPAMYILRSPPGNMKLHWIYGPIGLHYLLPSPSFGSVLFPRAAMTQHHKLDALHNKGYFLSSGG